MRSRMIWLAATAAFVGGALAAYNYEAQLRGLLGVELPSEPTAAATTTPDDILSVPRGDFGRQTATDQSPLVLTKVLGSEKVRYVASLGREEVKRFALGVGWIHVQPKDQEGFQCTASLIAENLVLTAGHCVTGQRSKPFNCSQGLPDIEKAVLRIGDLNAKDTTDGVQLRLDPEPVDTSWKHDCQDDPTHPLDYALFAVQDGELATARQWLPIVPLSLGDARIKKNQALLVLHHPGKGQPLIASTADCVVAEAPDDASIRHLCDTWPGSSGAPIFSEDHGVVIGVHNGTSGHVSDARRGGGVFNRGTRIAAIVANSEKLRLSGLLDRNPPTLEERLLLRQAQYGAAEADQRLNDREATSAVTAVLPTLTSVSSNTNRSNLFAHLTDFPSPLATLTEALTLEPLHTVFAGVGLGLRDVRSVAFSPQGDRLVVGYEDGVARIWRVGGGAFVKLLGDKRTPVGCVDLFAVTFDAAGRRVIAACRSGVMQWDAQSGDAVCAWGPLGACALKDRGDGNADRAAFSRDARRVAVAYDDGGRVLVWDLQRAGPPITLMTGASSVSGLAFSPDGTKLLVGAHVVHDSQARVFDVSEDSGFETVDKRDDRPVQAVAFGCDDRQFATAAEGVPIIVGKRGSESRQALRVSGRASRYGRADLDVPRLAFSPDGRILVSGSKRGTIATAWDVNSAAVAARLEAGGTMKDSVTAMAFDESGGRFECNGPLRATYNVAIGYTDGAVRLFKIRTGDLANHRLSHKSDVYSVAVGPEGQVATASNDKFVRVFRTSASSGEKPTCLVPSDPLSVAFSDDGKRLAAGMRSGQLVVFDPASCDESGLRQVKKSWLGPGALTTEALAFSPRDSQLLASGDNGGAVRLWRAPDYSMAWEHRQNRRITTVAFSFDGDQFATSSWDGTARIWRLRGDRLEGPEITLPHDQNVEAVAFSPDDRHVLTGAADGNARIWDLRQPANAAQPIVLKGTSCRPAQMEKPGTDYPKGGCPLRSVAFNRQGSHLLTGSQDGTALLWEFAETSPLTAFPVFSMRHTLPINSAAFSADGDTIATASQDGYVMLWNAWRLRTEETIAFAQIAREQPLQQTAAAAPAAVQSCPSTPEELLTTSTNCEPTMVRALQAEERTCAQTARCEQALRNYAIATCYFERNGNANEAKFARYRRASLARHVSKDIAAKVWLDLSPELQAAQCGD